MSIICHSSCWCADGCKNHQMDSRQIALININVLLTTRCFWKVIQKEMSYWIRVKHDSSGNCHKNSYIFIGSIGWSFLYPSNGWQLLDQWEIFRKKCISQRLVEILPTWKLCIIDECWRYLLVSVIITTDRNI